MRRDILIERRSGRIWFGEGKDRWSITDPCAKEHRFTQHDVACDWYYLMLTCPTTKLAVEKLRLIRRALDILPAPVIGVKP